MLECSVNVFDKRTKNHINTRTKSFATLEECHKWINSLTNRVSVHYYVQFPGELIRRVYSITNKEV